MSNSKTAHEICGLDRLPTALLIIAAIFLGLAPFVPEPHMVEKLRMLLNGTLRQPIDIFDLFFHLAPLVLLALKLILKTRR